MKRLGFRSQGVAQIFEAAARLVAEHAQIDVPGVQYLQFSPNGAHFSYSVNLRDGNEYVVFDGRPERPHPKMKYPRPCGITVVFSPDGNRHAYTAWTNTDGKCVRQAWSVFNDLSDCSQHSGATY